MYRKRSIVLLVLGLTCFLFCGSASGSATVLYEYDDLHRLTRVERPDGSVTVYEYDDFGNRTSKVVTAAATTPTVLFGANQTSGIAPLPVTFTDQSTGDITSWSWDFNDNGMEDSDEQNPTHIFTSAGTYTVSLTVTATGGSDTKTKADYITVADQSTVVANFTGGPTSGVAPLPVTFSDQSAGGITSWDWDFDNNGTVDSNDQSPTHIYSDPGIYSVSLTVTGPGGSDTKTRPQYIDVRTEAVGAELAVVPLSRDVSAQSGTTTFDVGNTGIGTMSWTAVANDPWLTITEGSTGTESGTVTVWHGTNMGPARTGTITITATGAANSPESVTVNQAATAGPDISIISPVADDVWTLGSTY
ncbi:MAG: PKD domain-containing protein, partial [Pseudomonadota bacterium]|nr:PKD domain-containing protein [Pseudomonadota bacterium]